ncbi:MAG: lysophospholipase, partial [Candidatus Obscuribacterales bacterium]|nr:lysophospholipase [Candidatus Obscuribacterales bacterium]
MRQLVLACRQFSARIISLFVAAFLALALCPAGFADSQVLEDLRSPLFQDLKVPVYTWMLVNSSPKAIVIALHGGCLHGRAYRTLGQSLAAKNYMLESLDMRGYGAWHHEGFGSKEDRRFNYGKSEIDVLLLVDQLCKYFPDTPV